MTVSTAASEKQKYPFDIFVEPSHSSLSDEYWNRNKDTSQFLGKLNADAILAECCGVHRMGGKVKGLIFEAVPICGLGLTFP